MLERVIHAIAERTGQAHRLGMVDHVLHTQGACNLHGVIGAAVIDDEQLDIVDAGNFLRHMLKHQRQGLLFVQAWNLYEEAH